MIYFIKSDKFVKIGCSIDPENRLKELQVANPIKLSLLWTMPGSYEHEKSFHEVFHAQRAKGEWFRIDGKLKECLVALTEESNPHKGAQDIRTFQQAGAYRQIMQRYKRLRKRHKSDDELCQKINAMKI